MKKLLFCLIICPILAACDKMDDNGDLGGYWQLLTWEKQSDGQVVADKTSHIFYCVSRELISMANTATGTTYLSTFHRTTDSLFLDATYSVPDTLREVTVLEPFGADETGRFRIVQLTGDRLVLSNTKNVLTFRKY